MHHFSSSASNYWFSISFLSRSVPKDLRDFFMFLNLLSWLCVCLSRQIEQTASIFRLQFSFKQIKFTDSSLCVLSKSHWIYLYCSTVCWYKLAVASLSGFYWSWLFLFISPTNCVIKPDSIIHNRLTDMSSSLKRRRWKSRARLART